MKVKQWKKCITSKHFLKESWGSLLISGKVDFRAKKISSSKQGYYTIIKMSVQQKDLTILNVNLPNRASK